MRIIHGDATAPEEQSFIIAHVCNNLGGWGAGFVLAVSNRWPRPEQAYRSIENYKLGTVQIVQVGENQFVANMIAQNGFASKQNPVAVDYHNLEICLQKLNQKAEEKKLPIVMPKIGCGLAGGNWDTISEIIERTLTVPVTVYEFD